jgi:hypothetical protein
LDDETPDEEERGQMVATEPMAERNLDRYGAPPIQWTRVLERLDEGLSQGPGSGGPGRHTAWLATVRPDGRPHVMPLGVLWVDGAFYFNAGAATRKAKNLAHDPHCTLTVATHAFDLVVEGEAVRMIEETRLKRIADVYASRGWQTTVRDGALQVSGDYSAPSAGPPPWDVYEVTPATIFALGTADPYGATRWRF